MEKARTIVLLLNYFFEDSFCATKSKKLTQGEKATTQKKKGDPTTWHFAPLNPTTNNNKLFCESLKEKKNIWIEKKKKKRKQKATM